MNTRKVARVVTGIRTEDGAGVKLTRVIGHDDVKDFDPVSDAGRFRFTESGRLYRRFSVASASRHRNGHPI